MTINLSAYKKLSPDKKNEHSILRGLHIKYGRQLKELSAFYPPEIKRLTAILKGRVLLIKQLDEEEVIRINEKIKRLTDKYAAVLGEIDLRKKKTYKRTPVGTTYYIDLTNGNDDRTGLKIGPSTIDSTADTTHFVDDALTGADDYINGSYFYNVTVGAGSLITDFVADTDTVTLADAIVGMQAGDTYYILDAWKTLDKYTSVTARTAGDIAYVRANTTQTLVANLNFDEAGTQEAIISIIGCDSVTNDPWVDASDVYPILSFGDSAYYVVLDCMYWLIKRLTIKDSTKNYYGTVNIQASGCRISYCNITDNGASASGGIFMASTTIVLFIDNCVFYNNRNCNINIPAFTTVFIDKCTFDGGAETTDYGIYIATATVYISNSTFGSTTAHDVQDIYAETTSKVHCKNCTFNKTTLSVNSIEDKIYSEDDDGVFGNQVDYYYTGAISKSATARDGGASSSVQMMPSSNCGSIFPLTINGILSNIIPDFAIYNISTSPITVTIYIRATEAWGTYPTAAQLYIEASYLSNAASAIRTSVVSDEVISDGSTWIGFQCTFTPARAGWIYLKVFLNLYEASKGILVDIKPVIS